MEKIYSPLYAGNSTQGQLKCEALHEIVCVCVCEKNYLVPSALPFDTPQASENTFTLFLLVPRGNTAFEKSSNQKLQYLYSHSHKYNKIYFTITKWFLSLKKVRPTIKSYSLKIRKIMRNYEMTIKSNCRNN